MKASSVRKLTYQDYLRFPDDGLRHELINGEHYVTPCPVTVHQRLVGRLHLALGNYLQASPIGEAFLAPFDVVLSNYDIVEPDLMVVLADQSGIVTDKHVRGAPAIVIEIASPSTRRRDERLKRDLYARAGIREYWLADPKDRSVRIWRTPAVGIESIETRLTAPKSLTSRLLPEFSLPLVDLFR